MYRVKGADQKEYGPISTEQVRQWIAENRLNRHSLAQREGESGWQPLAQFDEFADVLGAAPAIPTGAAPVPTVGAYLPTDATPGAAKSAVNGPGIALAIIGGLGVLFALAGIVLNMTGVSGMRGPVPQMPDANMQRMMEQWMALADRFGIISSIISIPWNLLVLFGGLKMRRLEGRGLAVTAAILAIIPCFSPCCLAGIPIGIWALVVLNRPEVKANFR